MGVAAALPVPQSLEKVIKFLVRYVERTIIILEDA